jgi:hypothetical protein
VTSNASITTMESVAAAFFAPVASTTSVCGPSGSVALVNTGTEISAAGA